MNNELMIDLIADALANFDDWDIVKDLKTSFNEAILLNDPKFDQQLLNRIYDNFMRIPTVDR
jgi:deoxyhypusine synthase